jgi:hypothetical protein
MTDQNPPTPPPATKTVTGPAENETFEVWLEKQPDVLKGLYETHTKGLTTALETERKDRKDLEKQLRDLAKKAGEGTEAQRALTEQADKLSSMSQQTEFFDKAHTAGVKNLKLAFLAAKEASLVDDKGGCDFAKLKAAYPELFAATPPGNAGNGQQGGQQQFSMNDLIRQKAGRQ